MCGLDGEVVVYTEAGHVFSRCVTTHSPLKSAELNVSMCVERSAASSHCSMRRFKCGECCLQHGLVLACCLERPC